MNDSSGKTSVEKLKESYETRLKDLESTLKNVRGRNEILSRKLYTLNNRAHNVAESIGFKSFDDMAEAALRDPSIWNVEAVVANHNRFHHSQTQEQEDENAPRTNNGKQDVSNLRKEFEELRRQVQELQQKPQTGTTASRSLDNQISEKETTQPMKSDEKAALAEVFALRTQLKLLTDKYDRLLAAKVHSEKKYKEDYIKWRGFKTWLMGKSVSCDDQLPVDHPDFPDVSFSISREGDEFIPQRESQSSPLVPSMKSENIPSTSNSRPHSVTTARLSHNLHGNHDTPTPASRKRVLTEIRLKPKTSSESNQNSNEQGKTPLTSSRTINAPNTDKGKEKENHSVARSKSDSINRYYKINTAVNDGKDFQFDEVVRGKQERHKLDAGDCDCCREYYKCLKPLPDLPQPPPWKSPSTTRIANFVTPDQKSSKHSRASFSENHKKQISRHRHKWTPPKTPPDYWNIAFPTTQEVEDINRRADEMHREKRRKIEAEANKIGGKYVRRDSEVE